MSFFQPKHTARVINHSTVLSLVGSSLTPTTLLSLEAGEDLVAGIPVCIIGNKFYIADPVTNFRVVGIVQTSVLATFLATVVTDGALPLAGLVSGTDYFLAAGSLTDVAPTSGRVIKVGTAATSAEFIVNIQLSVLLS